MSIPICSVCGRPVTEIVLHRANKKDESAVWICNDDRTFPIDPEIKQITDIVSGKKSDQ